MVSTLRNNRRLVLISLSSAALAVLVAVAVLSSSMAPARANPASSFAAVSAGYNHTCAVTSTGGVKCWGSNVYGQLGDGLACGTACPVQVQVSGLTSGVVAVAAGGFHTCAVTSTGAVKCWGRNSHGQLGDGTTVQRTTPVATLTLNSGVTAITTGELHSCAIVSGAAKCWGRNSVGQVGDGTVVDRPAPVVVTGLGSAVDDIDAGTDHTCAVVSGGARCWGRNDGAQLGNGSFTQSSLPVNVLTLGSGVAQVAGGSDHSCARTVGGAAKCWGSNLGGQLGDGQACSPLYCSTPIDVTGLGNGVSEIVAGGAGGPVYNVRSCALTVSQLMCWGDNYYGDVGDGTSFELRLTPVAVVGISEPIVEISTGGHHSCVLLDSGTVKCWGWNTSGQLGIGVQSEMVPTPQDVVLASSKPTPTPTASPTPCPPSTCPLDFYLNVESDPPFGYSCDTSGGSTTCSAPIGSALHASVILTGLGGVVAYDAAAVMLTYTGLGSKDNPNSVWPGCVLEASSPGAGFVHTGCAIGISQPSVAFVGEMATADFQCAANGNLTLVHGPADTLLIDNIGQTVYESGANETLTIQCASPQAYPGDTDGDTCPDANETGVNPLTGGLRNFVNPWDYFNPTHDGENRIDDVLVVRDQYYIDQGDLGYTADTDRTFFGPNEWDLGAPDGLQRVDDILNIVKHYFHDCS